MDDQEGLGVVVAFVSQKGGVGKTTSSVTLGFGAALEDYKVAIVDADDQRSSIMCVNEAINGGQSRRPAVFGIPHKGLDKEVERLRASFDLIIIDSAQGFTPEAFEISSAAVRAADLVIIPVGPSPLDLGSTGRTVNVIKERQFVNRGNPKAYFFVNKAQSNTGSGKQIWEVLPTLGLPVMKSSFKLREDHKVLPGLGSSAFSGGRDSKKEAKAFLDEVIQLLQEECLS